MQTGTRWENARNNPFGLHNFSFFGHIDYILRGWEREIEDYGVE